MNNDISRLLADALDEATLSLSEDKHVALQHIHTYHRQTLFKSTLHTVALKLEQRFENTLRPTESALITYLKDINTHQVSLRSMLRNIKKKLSLVTTCGLGIITGYRGMVHKTIHTLISCEYFSIEQLARSSERLNKQLQKTIQHQQSALEQKNEALTMACDQLSAYKHTNSQLLKFIDTQVARIDKLESSKKITRSSEAPNMATSCHQLSSERPNAMSY